MDPISQKRPAGPPAHLIVRPPMSLPPKDSIGPAANVLARRPSAGVSLTAVPKLPGQDLVPSGTLVIGPGINIKGSIETCDTLIVEGTVETTLNARRLEVRPGGHFLGEATVAEAEVEGRLDGKLKVSGTLVLGRLGRIKGSTRYAALQVKKGGQISGEIDARPVELTVAT